MKAKTTSALVLLAALLLTVNAADQQPASLTVAVYDFKGNGAAASIGRDVTTLITVDLTTETNLVLVERAELAKALSEQAFGASGMVSPDAVARIGQITGAKVLVAGQVVKTGNDHLILVANIIGTETGRLFASKVEGGTASLSDLASRLSSEIVRTIISQKTNLVQAAQESRADRLNRIVKTLTGTNRPAISINITGHNRWGNRWKDSGVPNELGQILMQAGFPVVDENSDRKPELVITGVLTWNWVKQRGGLMVSTANLELKVTEPRTGDIIAFDRQASTGTGLGQNVAIRASVVNVTDDLAERILPKLAK
ncbi:MAG: CsgG/HfaB family protein [Verrucomicrobiota bacterium]